MNQDNISRIINKIDSIPTLPAIVAQVLGVIADPRSTAGDLCKVITPDPALTISILKFANSAFLGLPKKVATLQHAIALMGFDEIRNLVLSKAICQSFRAFNKNAEFDIRKFWQHSFLSGLAAKIMAVHFKGNSSEFFVAGLIHDIGKLLIYIVFPEEYAQVALAHALDGAQLAAAEKTAFGLGHDEAGLRLARRWFLPSSLAVAIGFHHQFTDAEEHREFALVVHLADLLARWVDAMEMGLDEPGYCETLLIPETISIANMLGVELDDEWFNKFLQELIRSKEENQALLHMLIS